MSWAMIKKAVNSNINKSLDVLIEEKINGVSQALNEGRIMKAVPSTTVRNVFTVKGGYISSITGTWTHYGNFQITANGFQNVRVCWNKYIANTYDCKIVDRSGNVLHEDKFVSSGSVIVDGVNNYYQYIKIWGAKGTFLDIYAKSAQPTGSVKITRVETCFDLVPDDYLI